MGRNRNAIGFSLMKKTTLMIIIMSVVVTGISIFISYDTYKKTMNSYYVKSGLDLVNTAASQLDADKFDYYLTTLHKDDEYNKMLGTLKDIHANNDVLYLYVVRPVKGGFYFIFDTEDGGEGYESGGGCELGEYIGADENFSKQEDKLLAGEQIEPIITPGESEYGWLLSVSAPIKDSAGNMVGYVLADISMDEIVQNRENFLKVSTIIISLVSFIIILIYLWVVRRLLVKPIRQLSAAARDFAHADNIQLLERSSRAEEFKIDSKDEIGELAEAIFKMEGDIITYIANLTKITAEKERISTELDVAARIQASMLPDNKELKQKISSFEIFATMKPAKEVGGDFYDYFRIDETHMCVVAADVSGKGVPAALFMVVAKTMIKNYAQQNLKPAKIFEEANDKLIEINKVGLFVTAFLGILDITDGTFVYVNAGHTPPFYIEERNKVKVLPVLAGFVLAGIKGKRFQQCEVQMQAGDRIFLYTDGITEAESSDGRLFGQERLGEALNMYKDRTLNKLVQGVQNEVDGFSKDANQLDDITMLVFEYKEELGSMDEGDS